MYKNRVPLKDGFVQDQVVGNLTAYQAIDLQLVFADDQPHWSAGFLILFFLVVFLAKMLIRQQGQQTEFNHNLFDDCVGSKNSMICNCVISFFYLYLFGSQTDKLKLMNLSVSDKTISSQILNWQSVCGPSSCFFF